MKIVFHPTFLDHKMPGHPESPERLSLVKLEDYIEPEPRIDLVEKTHSPDYIQRVKTMKEGWIDPDTYVCGKTWKASLLAVGAAWKAYEVNGFALVRPPGHHATRDKGMGFCIFNNIAATALELARQGKKIAILDLDAHHGNGTQDLVLGNDNVIYFSTHQSPGYPGTGLRPEGNCFNFPLPPGSGDGDFFKSWNKFSPVLEEFDPDVIGLSLGFDSYFKDYGWLTYLKFSLKPYKTVLSLGERYHLFGVLEGGYNPESIKDGVDLIMNMGP